MYDSIGRREFFSTRKNKKKDEEREKRGTIFFSGNVNGPWKRRLYLKRTILTLLLFIQRSSGVV